MSCNYADGLSEYENKGILGLKEKFDPVEVVEKKCEVLAKWISQANHVVVHTGAGISTSAGIPDFRGPNGVWTLEKRGEKPNINISFDDAIPTKTHMALYKLIELNKVKYIVSQNIDGLHLKSGVPRKYLAELHGNMFAEQCNICERQFVRSTATTSVGQKCLNIPCKGARSSGRLCRGKLHDTILDWEASLPERDLIMSDLHSSVADLSICLGTTMQIVPSGNLPLKTKKNGGRIVIVNLQPTKHDRKADIIINTYVDDVFERVMKILNIEIPEYSSEKDFSKHSLRNVIEWTIDDKDVSRLKEVYSVILKNKVNIKRKKSIMNETDEFIKKRNIKDEIDNVKQKTEIESDVDEFDINHVKNEIVKSDSKYDLDIKIEDVKNEHVQNNIEPENNHMDDVEIRTRNEIIDIDSNDECVNNLEFKNETEINNQNINHNIELDKCANDLNTCSNSNTSSINHISL